MHKTLYIDVDEEITSIIDRVRKADAREVIIVAPKNAMLLQGIVNLRLLKKETDRRKKKLLILTHDKIGKKLIEKAGILAETKLDKNIFFDESPERGSYEPMYANEAQEIKDELSRERLEREIGSNDFFEGSERGVKQGEGKKKDLKTKTVPPADSEKTFAANFSKKEPPGRSINMSDIVVGKAPPKKNAKKSAPTKKIAPKEELIVTPEEPETFFEEPIAQPPKISRVSIKKAEKFFRGSRKARKDLEVAKVNGGVKKFFIIFAVIFVVLACVAAAYFFLPKAVLDLQLKNQYKTVSEDIMAGVDGSNIKAEERMIPATEQKISKDFKEDFEATGSKSGGAKATGKVVIYNEFGSEDQPLVATTRLETSDGKIFRIGKSVVVPGATKVGGETKAGAIEVEVAADQPGQSYNIGPSDFKIPGLKSDQGRFEKIYAKSAKEMTGGSDGETKIVKAEDISAAKEKISQDAKKSAIEELKRNLAGDQKIFDDSIQVQVTEITFSEKAGAEKGTFSGTVKLQAGAIAFKESDVQSIFKNSLSNSGENSSEISFDKPVSYILASFDTAQKTLKFKATTDVRIATAPDLENFKRGILGKKAEDAQVYAKNFPSIEKMDISFWPFFVSRIPANISRIEIRAN